MAERFTYARAYGSYPEGYTDTGVGSWLSEGINKVVGKKAGKKIEKGTNRFVGESARITKGVAAMVPGAGTAIAAGIDLFTEYKDLGARASKMSDGRIAEIALTNPVKAQALMQAKQMVMAEKANKLAKKRAAKQRQQMKRMNMAAPAPAPAAPKSNAALFVVGGALGMAWYFFSKKPKRRTRRK